MRAGGYLCVSVDGQTSQEFDTFTCAHCNGVTVVRPKTDAGGWCSMCSRAVCARCADGACTPFEKRLAEMEARYHALRSYDVD